MNNIWGEEDNHGKGEIISYAYEVLKALRLRTGRSF